ncbi:MAG: winged helix-turn-helix domain-containing protein [Phycisphaerales bacterium]|nr:winged helix-turn-helix domain-containing protein [Phycisphaerales bacterium]
MKKNDVEIGATYVAKVSGTLARVRIDRESRYGGWEATNVDTGRRVRIKSAQRLRHAAVDPKCAKAIAAADQQNARLRDERERSPDGMAASERAMANSAIENPEECATVGCGRPAALTYLGRPRCQACYEDEVADGDATSETPNHEETTMATTKKSKKSATKAPKATRIPKVIKPPMAAKPKATKPTAERRPTGVAKPKRVSAPDAAAEVLRKAGKPMRSQEMIAAMAEQGLWSSPNGRTPAATLYSALLREIQHRAGEARFKKSDRGLFEYAG